MRRHNSDIEMNDIQREESIQLNSEYAKIRFNKKGLAVGAIVVVVALALMMGFMIASVVIGVNITKEVGIRNGALVPYRGGNQAVLKTSTMTYQQPLSLYTPLSVIESTKTVTVNIKEGAFSGQFQFEVVSFVYIKGVQLVFYGHTHMATVLGDGSVQLQPLEPFDGAKRTEETQTSSTTATSTSTATGSSSVVTITTCQQLTSASDLNGQYLLGNDLNCESPIGSLFGGQTFNGNFNGNGKNLSAVVNGNGLFAAVQGTVQNLIFSGRVTGSGSCGGLAGRALAGALFSTSTFTGSIQCSADASGNSVVGGIAGTLVSSTVSTSPVNFRRVISQGTAHTGAGNARLGGLFGFADTATAEFVDSFVDSAISQTSSGSAVADLIGNTGSEGYCPTGVVCIVNNGAESPRACCDPVERCPNLPEDNNCGPSACFTCRDISLDRSMIPAVRSPVLPNFNPSQGNCVFF